MKNLFDYIEYFGNTSFKELAFNDIDSLILTQLVYAKMKDMAPHGLNEYKKLGEICELFLKKYSEKDFKKEDYLFPNSYRLMKALKNSTRFSEAKVSYYIEEETSETQFGAVTVRFSNGVCYIAFEGTDSSIVGWQEDLELMYRYPTLSQQRGKEYLEKAIKLTDRVVYIGGHSKGGNIAMYSYMNIKPYLKRRIKKVYNFDGPGFLDGTVDTKNYKDMLTKLKMFVPEQSVIGMIFEHDDYKVVKSHGIGILQHDAYTWCCFGSKFQKGILSKKSQKLESNLKSYLKNMSLNERRLFVQTLAKVCHDLNIKSVMQIREIRVSSIINFLRELRNVPEDVKKIFFDVIKLLVVGSN